MDDRDKFGRSYAFAFVLLITMIAIIIGIPALIYALYKASEILGALAFVVCLLTIFNIISKMEP